MIYQIQVLGYIEPSWSDWFNGLKIVCETGKEAQIVTTFTGPVRDQAALRGVLNRLWDLNLTIMSVIRVETPEELSELLGARKENHER